MSALPMPEGWKSRPVLFGVAGVACGLIFIYSSYKATVAAAETHWIAMAIELCAAVTFGIFAGAVIVQLTEDTTLRGRYDATGTTLEAVHGAPWFLGACAAMGLGSALYLLCGAHVHDDLPTMTGRDTGRLITLVVISLIGVAAIVRSMAKGKPALTLSPERIDYRYPADCAFTIAWDDIVDITGIPLAKRAKGTRPIVFELVDGTRAVIAHANTWVPGGTSLYWLCRHYWRHPASRRSELVNGVALERLASKRIPVA